jgi:SAM-dependent methyltransferase
MNYLKQIFIFIVSSILVIIFLIIYKIKEVFSRDFEKDKIEVRNGFEIKEKCIICGGEKFKLISKHKISYKKRGGPHFKYLEGIEKQIFYLVKCSNCGLYFEIPNLSDENLLKYYNSSSDEILGRKEDYYPIISEIKKFKEEGTILDIGCGWGGLLEAARDYGYQGKGVEIMEKAREYCKELGFEIYSGDFLNTKIEEKFDIITLQSVLEHTKNPEIILKRAREILKEDGILVISVPNYCISAKILGRNWQYLWPIEHIYYFRKDTIKKILQKTGFSLSLLKTSPPDPELNWYEKYSFFAPFLSFIISGLNQPLFKKFLLKYKIGDVLFCICKKTSGLC